MAKKATAPRPRRSKKARTHAPLLPWPLVKDPVRLRRMASMLPGDTRVGAPTQKAIDLLQQP